MSERWTVQNAKAKLSEVLARARAGKPQRIGVEESCVVVSEEAWRAGQETALGAWLVKSAPRGAPVAAASRASKRGDPFATSKGKRPHKGKKV